MSNAQSIDLLRELNAKLLTEIAELRKENAEIPDLRRKFAEIEAEKAELNSRIAELLRQAVEENKQHDDENVKLKARIEELEKNKEDSSAENIRRDVEIAKIKVEIVKLKDNNEENKELTQDISPERIDNVYNSISDQCDNATSCVSDQKSSEDREMDTFLNEARKQSVSDGIRQRNKEKKLSKASFNQDQESDTGLTINNYISSGTSTSEISARSPCQNSHRKKGAENIVQLIVDGIKDDAQSNDKATPCDVISIESLCQNSSIDSLLSLAQLFDKADDAEYGAICANQEEILHWYYYGKEFLTQVSVIVQDGKGKIGKKKAKGIIYDKMLEHLSILRKQRSEETELRLPEISHKNLQRKTQKAVKIYKLFEKVGIDNIKYITTYSANSISELTNDKVQDIIDNFSKHNDSDNTDVEEVSSLMTEISAGSPGQNSAKVSELIAPIPLTYDSNSLGNSSFMPQITLAEAYFNDPMPLSMEKGTNEVQTDYDSDYTLGGIAVTFQTLDVLTISYIKNNPNFFDYCDKQLNDVMEGGDFDKWARKKEYRGYIHIPSFNIKCDAKGKPVTANSRDPDYYNKKNSTKNPEQCDDAEHNPYRYTKIPNLLSRNPITYKYESADIYTEDLTFIRFQSKPKTFNNNNTCLNILDFRTICCNRQVSVTVSRSVFPQTRLYVDGKMFSEQEQTDLGRFILYGGRQLDPSKLSKDGHRKITPSG
ncbi:563_t:CDS:2 [Cetraspora pellucida]|uniref:563_t:CDS:1 n=1 Tax=Cetraspora pellucida TaxID=1433469 RepID=A0A9N9HT85_9GLOM|nr:563_t:CDS:2 [Cetraspora pellucida]